MSSKPVAAAKAEARLITTLARDAVFSGAWVWPIRGLFHIATHPMLIKPLIPAILSSTLFTLVVTILLFIFTYLPQVAFMAIFSGPLAFMAAIPLVLGEAAAIGLVVSRIFWLGPAMEDLFDAVLLERGLVDLVSRGREIKSANGKGRKLGKLLTKPFKRFSKDNLIRWVVSLPLNALPIVGPILFFLYNGAKSGPSYHARYFDLKSRSPTSATQPMTPFDKNAFVSSNRGAYTAFGAMAMLLDVIVPGGAVLCLLGNIVGAALWAEQIEKREKVD